MKRREFINKSTQFSSGAILGTLLTSFDWATKKNPSIEKIELFRYDINIPRYFSFGTWHNRQQLFMKITAGDYYGWSEMNGSNNNPDFDLKENSKFLHDYKNLKIHDAYELLKSRQTKGTKFNKNILEFIELGLLDVLGKMEGKPATTLLGMSESNPVPGLYCVLNHQPDKIAKYINIAMEQNLHHFMKFKMYGDDELDLAILKQGREMLGDKPHVISDANRGYKNWKALDELVPQLVRLRENGLDGMEDPAELTNQQWIELQSQVGELTLIPDYPTRPSWETVHNIKKGMGRIYNLHPATMGSIHHLTKAAEKIKSFGAGVMIGDASLVGPACNAWQQIAIGLGAEWVEAIEKKEESADYITCIQSKPTYRNASGLFACDSKPGFGLELDEQLLEEICKAKISI